MTATAGAHRLALGLEPRDAVTGGRVPPPLRVLRDGPLPPDVLARLAAEGGRVDGALSSLDAHATGRHALRYALLPDDPVPDHVSLRVVETSGLRPPRRFVPRRLRMPLRPPDEADGRATGFRVRRPVLFPGAAYPLPGGATGLRGRVLRDGMPARWARVEARRPGSVDVLARAHGDDRGEFLLVVPGSARSPGGELDPSVTLEVRVFLPDPAPSTPPPDQAAADLLWDLPLEVLSDGEVDDDVSLGRTLPGGYTAVVGRELDIPLGAVRSEPDPFEF